jgi:autotransporter translocation and assembly factor TamB
VRKKWAKRIGVAAVIVAALVVVAVVAARLWIGSARGRRTVERKIDRAVAAATHAGGHVHLGRISGSLVGGATLDDVEWRDAAGNVALRARRVVARWSAARAIAKRPAIELRVESPLVDVDRLLHGVDFDEAARSLSRNGEKIHAVTVTHLEVVDATVRAGGASVGGVGVSGALAWDRAAQRLDADRVAVRAGASSAVVSGRVARDAIDLRLTSLRIGPEDLRRLSPRAEAPRTPLVGEARIHGRSDDAMVLGELRPDRGRALLAGTLDLRHRRASLRATLDDVEADYTPAVLAGDVRVRARLSGGVLALDWRAAGHYFRRELDPNLPETTAQARGFAAVRPGGRFAGRGHGVAHLEHGSPAARMRFVLTVDDPGQAARLLAGPDLRADTVPLVIDGDWRLGPEAPATLTLRRR